MGIYNHFRDVKSHLFSFAGFAVVLRTVMVFTCHLLHGSVLSFSWGRFTYEESYQVNCNFLRRNQVRAFLRFMLLCQVSCNFCALWYSLFCFISLL